jgi:Na+/melibiose symporter-like transporter
MSPNSLDKMNLGRLITFSLSFFTVLLAWSYFNFKVPLLLEKIIPAIPAQDIIIGTIMAVDNIVAVILQPFFGHMSDRTQSKLGRRMPYIIFGTLISAFFFILIPIVQSIAGIILIIFLFDLFMATFRSTSVAIVPDYTPDKFRSAASSTQQFVANIGGLIGFLMPSIIGGFKLSDPFLDRTLGFWIIAVLMVIAVVIMMMKIKETPSGNVLFHISPREIEINSISFELKERQIQAGKDLERPSAYGEMIRIFKEDRSMAYMLCAVFFLYLGFAGVEAFFSRFAINYFKVAEGTAGLMLFAYSGPMILSAPFHGILGQKIGRKKALKICLIWQALAVALFAFVLVPTSYGNANVVFVMLNLALISIPWMGVIVQSFPVMWALAPEGKVGSYMGIYYTFNQTGYSISPILLGAILSIFNFMGDMRFTIMFPYVLICLACGFLFFLRVKGGEEKLSEEKMQEYKEKYLQDD